MAHPLFKKDFDLKGVMRKNALKKLRPFSRSEKIRQDLPALRSSAECGMLHRSNDFIDPS